MKIKTIPRASGLGDIVAKVAQPIANVVDAVAGTNLANCGGCKRRQQKLNQKFPMKKLIILTILLNCATWSARALDYTYSTNGFYALNYYTNIYIGTNASDGTTNGDTFSGWAWKINAAMNLTQRRWDIQQSTNNINASNTAALFVSSTNGITTNISVAVTSGTTNTLYFTNGILKKVTSP